MTGKKAYSVFFLSGCMHGILKRYMIFWLSIFILSTSEPVSAQDLSDYDEISVYLEVPGVGGGEISAVIKGEELFLPVTDLFDFLKIKNDPSQDLESVSGFFIDPQATFSISRTDNKISYQNKETNLEPGDLIRTESNLYLRSSYFGRVFGLDCGFNFRSLSVIVDSKLELPLIREMRLEEMRKNISRLKGETKADTSISRTHPLFKFGMADWSAVANEEINGPSSTRLNLNLGSMLAGGEATVNLYYNSTDPFSEKQQYYMWRYVNNDFAPLRQVIAGKIAANAISSIYNPVVGVQLTNTPTTYRRSFGSYTLSDRTEPGWIVELYVNNILVDYIKADASGFFTFEVPLVYGNTTVRLKFFGPWGEERSREQNIRIPFNFLPVNTFEYNVSAGIVEDTLNSFFSRGSMNYGLTPNITIGGGTEYLTSVSSQPFMPFINTSVRVTNNILLSGEYTHGVRAKGTFSYRLPSNVQLDLNYIWYNKDQKAIFYNYREDRKATLSFPLKIGKFFSYQRFSMNQIILPSSKYTTGEWMISGSLLGVNANLSTYALIIDDVKPQIYSNLSTFIRLPAGFTLMPQIQYSYSENEIYSARARLEKRFLDHAYMHLSYEQNFRNNLKLAEAGIRYDFSFAQMGASVRQSNERTSFIQYARGSLINDRKTRYLGADNRTNVGRGGISLVPYLDINSNGKKDPGEPKVSGLNLRANSGRVEKSDRDTTIRILGLEPYTDCFIDLDPNSFENISWRLPKQTYKVAVDPNILKSIEIPVIVVGEVTGTVMIDRDGEITGLSRIIVNIYPIEQKKAVKTLTEEGGYYSYLGLTTGAYTVRIDTSQLRKLKMTSTPELYQFNIVAGQDGDIVDGLDFTLKKIPVDTVVSKEITPEIREFLKKDTSYMILHELTEEVYTITEDSWAIQIGAFRSKSYAEGFQRMLERELGKDVQITIEGDFYRVRILDLPTRKEVDENVAKLNELGFKELWIIKLIAMQKQRILITREDSLAQIRETLFDLQAPLTPAEKAEMQLNAFRLRSEATDLRRMLSAPLDKKVEMDVRRKYYTLETPEGYILDPTALEAIEGLDLSFGRLGMEEKWMVRAKALIPEAPVKREPVFVQKASVHPGTTVPVFERKTAALVKEEKREVIIPSIALQVAIYHKETQALRAQKKIMTKLNLPVEIIQQFDYYHVIVTGFYSREETFQYYPELAGIGFPRITLLENYKRQK